MGREPESDTVFGPEPGSDLFFLPTALVDGDLIYLTPFSASNFLFAFRPHTAKRPVSKKENLSSGAVPCVCIFTLHIPLCGGYVIRKSSTYTEICPLPGCRQSGIRRMTTIKLLTSMLLVLANFSASAQTNCNTIGDQTFCNGPNGTSTTTKIGDQSFTIRSDGTTSHASRIGNNTFVNSSDGSSATATRVGSSTFVNGAPAYGQPTAVTKTCNKIGNSTFCN